MPHAPLKTGHSIPLTGPISRWMMGIHPAVWTALAFFLALGPWLGKNRLLGLDESMYAQVALGAARDHHWLPLIFEGNPFWEKPPLVLWLQALALWVGGPQEFSLRFWSALSGALALYFIYRLGETFGGSSFCGFCCALLTALQEHFILYSRLATMDMPLACCLAGFWWNMTQALDPTLPQEASRKIRGAGLWLVLGIWVKSWFGLIFLPAALVVLGLHKPKRLPWPRTAFQLLIPAFLAVLSWILLYRWVYGPAFWEWEWNHNVLDRVRSGLFPSLGFSGEGGYHWKFYMVIAQEGLPFLWPLLPLAFFLWVRDPGKKGFGPGASRWMGCLFFFYYLFFLAGFMATLINYVLPLVPVAAVSCAWFFRSSKDPRVEVAGILACLLATLNGYLGFETGLYILLGALGLCAIPFFPWVGKGSLGGARSGALVLLLGGAAFRAQHYLIHPPDPNRVWVAAVLAHPASYPGESLLFVGEHTDARALEFYSRYQVKALAQMPRTRPPEALLFQEGDRAIFLPAQE